MSRLSREDGFTLPELLVAISMSTIILLGAFGLVDTVMRRTTETQGRIEATQRGRTALEAITRPLRSQVCLNAATPPIAAATPTSITFYTDLSNGTAALKDRIERRTIRYNAGRLTEEVYRPTGADPIAYPALPTTTRVLASNVEPESGTTTIFSYFAYTEATGTIVPQPTVPLPNPAAADRARIAMISLAFKTNAGKTGSILLRDQIFVRSVDPNEYTPDATVVASRSPRPTCV